jgi:hypothetical protein
MVSINPLFPAFPLIPRILPFVCAGGKNIL